MKLEKKRIGFRLGVAACALSFVAGFDAEAAAKKHSLLIPVTEGESLSRPQRVVLGAQASASSVRERHIQALELAMKNDTKASLAILAPLAAMPLGEQMSADEHDRVLLTMGRVKYQTGDFAGAIESYKAVRKGGPSWLEALEERAGAQMRIGQTQEALATLKTVLTPLFKDRILSEPYFLAALGQLRVCDYKSVFKTIDLFKERFRDRVKEWDAAKSDAGAQARLGETRETIQKLNLVEAEAIQHLYIDENGKRQAGSPPKIGRERDQLTFPMDAEMDSKEVWLDEVDDYRVTVKGCPVQASPTQAASPSLAAKKAGTL